MMSSQINLNHLKVFEVVYKTRSMTTAAKSLHLTQSGVSQHIKALEESLEIKLFDRINQRLIPTSLGKEFYQDISEGMSLIETALYNTKGDKHELSGLVNIGSPIQFGLDVIIPALKGFHQKHPKVLYHLNFDFASALNDFLLEGKLDFAFVDNFAMSNKILVEKIYSEKLILCMSKKLAKKYPPKNTKEYYQTLPIVEYQEGAPVFKLWLDAQIKVKNFVTTPIASVMDAQGIASFILQDMGAGILPETLFNQLTKKGAPLIEIEGSKKEVRNDISVAYVKKRTHSPSAASLLEWFRENLK